MGRRKRPFYRIVAIDSRTHRDGREIERLGWFDPLKTDVAVDLKEDRIIHWLQKGAQPSETVGNILNSNGLQYKLHLIREGKSEDEIASALTEWQLRQEEIKARKEEKKKTKKKAITAQSKAVTDSEESGETKPEKSEVVTEDSTKVETAAEESPVEESPEEAITTDAEKETEESDASTEESIEVETVAVDDTSEQVTADKGTEKTTSMDEPKKTK